MLIDAYDQSTQQDASVHDVNLDDAEAEEEAPLRADDCRSPWPAVRVLR